jgi:hypothetical protein
MVASEIPGDRVVAEGGHEAGAGVGCSLSVALEDTADEGRFAVGVEVGSRSVDCRFDSGVAQAREGSYRRH